jgi:hypothetical protein
MPAPEKTAALRQIDETDRQIEELTPLPPAPPVPPRRDLRILRRGGVRRRVGFLKRFSALQNHVHADEIAFRAYILLYSGTNLLLYPRLVQNKYLE